ncbi:MAG: hypothetical protein NC191_08090 [Muribaculaceae bacterium]|nr:hypothetical protein [Muribaculaceae bacterium]
MKKLTDTILKPGGAKAVFTLLLAVAAAGMLAVGCAKKEDVADVPEPAPVQEVAKNEGVSVPPENTVDLEVDDKQASKMVSYDVVSIGRADPFMPSDELDAFEDAKRSAYAEASAYNAKIAEIEKLRNTVIREPDDISPYSFNLPVPPTSLASSDAAAAKITRTKVVGIMYNKTSPSAIINVDDKDYLVRQGDKIIGQEYKVMEINPSWITVNLGSNVYSAAIGELFSKADLDKSQNDLYNLRNRFGGRKG